MLKKGKAESQSEDLATFNRRFKYALVAYAIIEFIVIALVVYYQAQR